MKAGLKITEVHLESPARLPPTGGTLNIYSQSGLVTPAGFITKLAF